MSANAALAAIETIAASTSGEAKGLSLIILHQGRMDILKTGFKILSVRLTRKNCG
jgi:hypothetical protein